MSQKPRKQLRALLTKEFLRAQEEKGYVPCHYCGVWLTEKTRTKDHKTPTSRGGKHALKNIVFACEPCNNLKADKLYGTFMKEVNAARAALAAQSKDSGVGE